VGQLEAALGEMKIELAAPGVKSVYVPDAEKLDQCFALGQTVAEKVKERV
jgi:virulence-associated protein VagC